MNGKSKQAARHVARGAGQAPALAHSRTGVCVLAAHASCLQPGSGAHGTHLLDDLVVGDRADGRRMLAFAGVPLRHAPQRRRRVGEQPLVQASELGRAFLLRAHRTDTASICLSLPPSLPPSLLLSLSPSLSPTLPPSLPSSLPTSLSDPLSCPLPHLLGKSTDLLRLQHIVTLQPHVRQPILQQHRIRRVACLEIRLDEAAHRVLVRPDSLFLCTIEKKKVTKMNVDMIRKEKLTRCSCADREGGKEETSKCECLRGRTRRRVVGT